MKMQPRFSFSVDSLLGRKTNESDIKSECLGGYTDLHEGDPRGNRGSGMDRQLVRVKIEIS